MTKQLKSLFSQLAMTLDMEEGRTMGTEFKDYLKLDHNSVYGGYVLMVVHPKAHHSESFFIFSNRMSCKEMTRLIQGYLTGYTKAKGV